MKRPFPLRPRSVPGLILACFGLVALPLIAAVIFGVVYVDRLTEQSERLVLQGVQVTRYSKQLSDSITAMERNVRQYAVVGDPSLAASFADNHRAFQKILGELDNLQMDVVPDWDLDKIRQRAQSVAKAMAASTDGSGLKSQFDTFDKLHEDAQAIAAQGNRFIDSELRRLQATSRKARSFLLLCVFALIPGAVLLVVLFTFLISRPIRQMQQAMRLLGEGDFNRRIEISAPSTELEALGTQLDWMRRRLAALEAEKNQFLRHMSHELKTPLAGIREGVDLLRDGTLGGLSEKQAEVVEILQRNGLELTALIENLLNFAQWRQQRARLERSTINLRELTDQVIGRHQLTIDKKALHVTLPPPDITISADRDQIRLVLDNLIANAVRFSPQGGGIRIRAWRGRRGTVLDVSDDGPGIAREEREHVFTPFYQAEPTKHTHLQGTGIGLSVVREGVRAHGGEIRLLEGNGACFRITLPDTTQQGASK